MSTYSKRILAGALSLALCLSPAALAAKTEEPPLVAAVEGLSPLLYEPDPAAGYRAALGWTGETGEDGVLRLSDGLHKIELPVGRRALLDGTLVRLSGPTVERSGGRCLPLSDLCPLLGVQATVTDQGVELAPRQATL